MQKDDDESTSLHKFRIVHYDELDDVSQLTSLYYLSLNWPVTPQLLEKKRRDDERYVQEFGLFAVADDGTVIGGVFVMMIQTKTLKGKLAVGGINAVATRPGYQRRGVMTTLMNRCHRYFAEQQIDYSFLTTSQNLGAHSMYKKLGYEDLAVREIAWKTSKKPFQPAERLVVKKFREGDEPAVYRTFVEATKDSYGFVYRPPNFLEARIDGPFPKPSPIENMRLVYRDNEVTGYAYWESSAQFSVCTEILAQDRSSFTSLLADAETRYENKVLVIQCSGLGKKEIGWLRSAHYCSGVQTYGTIMVKSIGGRARLENTKALFAVDDGLFRMGVWDYT